MYSENQIEIFVLISSISLAVFILLTVYFIVRLKLKDIQLKKSKKKLEKYSNNLESLVEERTSQLMEKERSYKNLYEINKGILENSPAGIIRLDKNFHVTYENPEIKRILRVGKNEDSNLMNKDIRKVAPVKNSKKV
ncbi:MAG: PAS domain-containing protein, partial [Candidatus Cloacimonetes bacterium]|nr:PAS domain-containing protein [Candidatus Cloacimonadota bacterium]